MISVIIPTVRGREHWLRRALEAYERNTVSDWELILEFEQPTCSIGWNLGCERAKGRYIHFSSDDVEPQHGWDQAAMRCVLKKKSLPCADLIDAQGKMTHCGDSGEEHLQVFDEGSPSAIARMPFFPRELMPSLVPVMRNHYMSDYWIAWKAEALGWPTVVVHNYLFVHHHAKERRLETLAADVADYHVLTRGEYG